MPKLRLLKPDDGALYADIRRRMLIDSPWAFLHSVEDDSAIDPSWIAGKLAEPENIIVGAEDPADPTRLVAAAGAYRPPAPRLHHRAQIWGVWSDPAVRGQGVGRAVVAAVIDEVRGWRDPVVDSIGLSVSERALVARRMYEDLGFVAWGVEPGAMRLGSEALDEIHMVLEIGTR